MLAHDARRRGRTAATTACCCRDQDRSLWDDGQLGGPRALATAIAARGPYALQAAIAVLHTDDPWTGRRSPPVRRAGGADRLAGGPVPRRWRSPRPATRGGRWRWWTPPTAQRARRLPVPALDRAELLERLGRPDEARAAYETCVERSSTDGTGAAGSCGDGWELLGDDPRHRTVPVPAPRPRTLVGRAGVRAPPSSTRPGTAIATTAEGPAGRVSRCLHHGDLRHRRGRGARRQRCGDRALTSAGASSARCTSRTSCSCSRRTSQADLSRAYPLSRGHRRRPHRPGVICLPRCRAASRWSWRSAWS
jgi:hypothetical protein